MYLPGVPIRSSSPVMNSADALPSCHRYTCTATAASAGVVEEALLAPASVSFADSPAVLATGTGEHRNKHVSPEPKYLAGESIKQISQQGLRGVLQRRRLYPNRA